MREVTRHKLMKSIVTKKNTSIGQWTLRSLHLNSTPITIKLSRTFDDIRSVGSGKFGHPKLSSLFFENTVIQQLEQLLEHHQDIESDEDTQAVMVTVLSALQCLYIANDQGKSVLDDYGQKWKNSPSQFELNRKFARTHNPTDDNMVAGPDIYDNYKHQVIEVMVRRKHCQVH